jgi:S1-C subfamily serine protease
MFVNACQAIRETVYGVIAYSQIKQGKTPGETVTNGTGFMIAPSYIITASHVIHQNSNVANPRHTHFEVVCIPDIGQPIEHAKFIAEDQHRDLALLQIEDAKHNVSVTIAKSQIPWGRSVGSLGFPLSSVIYQQGKRMLSLQARFQGSHISSFLKETTPNGVFDFYETDVLMYGGSSGCPGFLPDGVVIGMQVRSVISETQKSKSKGASVSQEDRLAISLWVPSMNIIRFANGNGVTPTVV